MYTSGTYQPLSTETAVEITKEMYKILTSAGINIIRVGLKSTDLITEGGEIQGHTFHPAFRQLVEGRIAREELEKQLVILLNEKQIDGRENHGTRTPTFAFLSSGESFSNMIGNAKANKLYFQEKYPYLKIKYKVDSTLEEGRYTVIKC
jgi:histone acetyltransferase (RNA polymerase elongator complex component)